MARLQLSHSGHNMAGSCGASGDLARLSRCRAFEARTWLPRAGKITLRPWQSRRRMTNREIPSYGLYQRGATYRFFPSGLPRDFSEARAARSRHVSPRTRDTAAHAVAARCQRFAVAADENAQASCVLGPASRGRQRPSQRRPGTGIRIRGSVNSSAVRDSVRTTWLS